MKRIAVAMLLMSTPVMADVVSEGGAVSGKSEPYTNNPSNQPQANTVGQPNCNAIGQTLHGELVFPLGCPVAVTLPAGATQTVNPDGSVTVAFPTGGNLQNSNPSGLPPSQTSGGLPSGYSNVTSPDGSSVNGKK
jgi:hypothetical protein